MEPTSSEQGGQKFASASRAVAELTLKQAIFCLEHPFAVSRDFAGREESAWERINELRADARERRPLLWQAYEARRDRQERERSAGAVGTVDAADVIAAWQASGAALPAIPPLPPGD